MHVKYCITVLFAGHLRHNSVQWFPPESRSILYLLLRQKAFDVLFIFNLENLTLEYNLLH